MALQYQFDDRYDDQYWHILAQLHFWATPEIVLLGQKLYLSNNWHKRLLAVHIISQLSIKDKTGGVAHTPYAVEESQALLYKALDDECKGVISSAICGLGHRPMPSATLRLVAFASHKNEYIRRSVAWALCANDGDSYKGDSVIEVLLTLAMDEDDDVRDWATFALGSLHEDVDSPAIREILWRNVFNENESVSGEALVGLAKRKDLRVVSELKHRLTPDCNGYELHAAKCIADPSLFPYLESIKQFLDDNDEASARFSFWSRLSEALVACKLKI